MEIDAYSVRTRNGLIPFWAVAKKTVAALSTLHPYPTDLASSLKDRSPPPFLYMHLARPSFLQEPGRWIRAYHANRSMLRHDGLNWLAAAAA